MKCPSSINYAVLAVIFLCSAEVSLQSATAADLTTATAMQSEEIPQDASLVQPDTDIDLTTVTAGIAAYDSQFVNYEATSGEQFQITFGEPVVVSVASRPEKWGYFQFPNIGQNASGDIWVKWNLSADSIKAYGKGNHGLAVSKDGGKTWAAADDTFTTDGGTLLANGDRIHVTTPAAIPDSELELPEPVGKAQDNYAKKAMTLYRHDELPESRQGVYLERLTKNESEWEPEHARLIDPKALRYSFQDLVPVVWWGDMHVLDDGSAITGIYPGFWQDDRGGYTPQYGVIFYRSADNGKSWQVQGRIPYTPDASADPHGSTRMGFSEPGFEVLADGTFVCVMRTADGAGPGPMYVSTSQDHGKNWTVPKAITPNGVLPRLLQLDNGVTVLSAGRPGVQLRFSTDSKGLDWTQPFEMLPWQELERNPVSCAYTGLLPTGPDRFLIVYSDFKHKNEAGEIRKAIKVREITVKR